MTETLLFLGLAGIGLTSFITFVVWSLVWKGMALWTAATNKSKTWFVIFMVLNTLTILEILYVLYFSKKNTLKKVDEKVDEKINKVSKDVSEDSNESVKEEKEN